MWKPYLNVLAQEVFGAIHALDCFHSMQAMNKAIDEVHAEETRQLKRDGYEPILKQARWCLLKRLENLMQKQTVRLAEVVQYNLKSVRSYLPQEDFSVSGHTNITSGRVGFCTSGVPKRCDHRSSR